MNRTGAYFFVFLLILVFFKSGTDVRAQADTLDIGPEQFFSWDQSRVEYRMPPREMIREWQNDPNYRYERDTDGPGIWNFLYTRFLHWLFSFTEGHSWGYYVILVLAGLLVLVALVRLLDVPFTGIFVMSRKGENSALLFHDEENDFSSSKLKDMLRMFRNNGAYREAVRVMFILYLKELDARGVITIKRFKTNHDYYREIQSPREKERIRKRKWLFDIVWYGHAVLSSVQFREIEQVFDNHGLKNKRTT
jgi:hypothetical protein